VLSGLQVRLIPNIQHIGAASLRQLSSTAIDPDIQPEDAVDSSDGDESGSPGTERRMLRRIIKVEPGHWQWQGISFYAISKGALLLLATMF
jgi:hypothetical protein